MTDFPLMWAIGDFFLDGPDSLSPSEVRLWTKGEAALEKKRYSPCLLGLYGQAIEAGYVPGQTLAELQEERGLEGDEGVVDGLKDPPLHRDFPRAVVSAFEVLF